MSKRILSLFLSVLISGLMAVNVFATDAKITVKTPDAMPKAGETFDVTVDISGNPGFSAFQIAIEFDKTSMTFEEGKFTSLTDGAFTDANEKNGVVKIGVVKVQSIKGDGTIVKLTFKALKDIGSFAFKVSETSLNASDESKIAFELVLPKESTEVVQQTQPSGGAGTQSGSGSQISGGTSSGTASQSQTGASSETTPPPAAKDPVFKDVTTHWGREFIEKAAELKLFNGYTDGTFKPDVNVTRGQFVTVLYRMAKSPEVEVKTPFTDISSQSAEFQKAIAWAYKNEYVNGVSETKFDPNGTLTREAAMKILFFYSGGASGMESMLTGIYDQTFTDSGTISSWAKAPMYWGIYKGLISGTSATTLSPKGTATRAQLAKILVNYLEKIK